MEPQIVGIYAIMLAGLFAAMSMILWMFKRNGPTVPSVMLVILGFGVIGVGRLRPTFLGEYVHDRHR